MDGSHPETLLKIESPQAITLDIENKLIYFSTQNPPSVSTN